MGFPRYRPLGWMNWAPVLGLRQEPGLFTGHAYKYFFNPASWTWGVGLRAYFLNPFINTEEPDESSSVQYHLPQSPQFEHVENFNNVTPQKYPSIFFIYNIFLLYV